VGTLLDVLPERASSARRDRLLHDEPWPATSRRPNIGKPANTYRPVEATTSVLPDQLLRTPPTALTPAVQRRPVAGARWPTPLPSRTAKSRHQPQLGVDGADVAHARSLGRRASTSTSPSKRTWPSAVNCAGIKKRFRGHRAFRAPPRLVDGVAGGAGWRSRRGSSSSAAAAERAGR
jgi:hypothetical protein